VHNLTNTKLDVAHHPKIGLSAAGSSCTNTPVIKYCVSFSL
jgi:hypothetical protein